MKSRLQALRSRWVIGVLIVALLYYGGASLGLRLAFEKTNASPVWPSSGIALAAVLLLGYRVWPGIAVGAFLANVVGFLAHQAASALTVVVVSLTIGVGNTVEAIAGAFLLHRLVGTRNPFYRAQDGFRFTAVALLACCVSPSIGSTSVSLAGIAPPAVYGTIWFTWWLGDAIGMLLVTPLLLTWGDEPQVRWSVRGHVEAGLLFVSLLVAGWIGFGGWLPGTEAHYPLAFVPIPWLVWAAFRFGPRGAASAAVITSAIAIWDTVHGVGPFVQTTVNESLLLLQAFVGIVTVTILTMAAAVAERREAEARLRTAHDSLETRVEERTRELRGEVTERQRAEAALRQSEEQYRLLFEANPYPMWVFDPETFRFLAVNDAAIEHYGYSRDEFLAMTILDIRPPEDVPAARALELAVGPGLARRGEWRHRKKDRTIIDVEITREVVSLAGRSARLVLVRDITDLKRAAREREALAEQLRQAQKMEAIGRLAGGVAHDFNNLLTVVAGRCHLFLHRLAPHDPGRRDLELIQKTAERAAKLTRQLLAFSRKQVLEPKVLDLSAMVAAVEPFLRRLLGEDIDLAVKSQEGIGRVTADPGQIEQVILNLAINARDAMPRGGRLTIETANVDLDETYTRLHAEVHSGPHVMLAVMDTGVGMDAATQARLFEPFFTTKDSGKGTGLGLATVYGIVKQSGGHIAVYSEAGRGATFKVYLPRVEGALEAGESVPAAAPSSRGSETVLLVEHEPEVRELAREALKTWGYTVLKAGDPAEALGLAERHDGLIHLLVTDLIMPGMNGRELADRLLVTRPTLKLLFIAGYTDSAIIHHEGLDSGSPFLQKPYTPDALVRRAREVIDQPPASHKPYLHDQDPPRREIAW